MKLSEAIIKGCEGTYQIEGRDLDGQGGYCVLATGQRAVGLDDNTILRTSAEETFRILERKTTHPEIGEAMCVGDICTDLNDDYLWPRLSIAEWLANVVEPEFEK